MTGSRTAAVPRKMAGLALSQKNSEAIGRLKNPGKYQENYGACEMPSRLLLDSVAVVAGLIQEVST